ncbi:MAG: hypothetical protein ACI4LK_06900, partial [Lentihominibacter sp.]
PKEVYQRHKYCKCLVTYESGGKRSVNVHTKKKLTDEEITLRRSVGLEKPLKKNPSTLMNKAQKSYAESYSGVENTKKSAIIKLRDALNREDNYEIYSALIENAKMFERLSPETIMSELERAGLKVKPLSRGTLKGISFEDGGGFKANFGKDGVLLYHPEQYSHHGEAYVKISSGKGVRRYNLNGEEIK